MLRISAHTVVGLTWIQIPDREICYPSNPVVIFAPATPGPASPPVSVCPILKTAVRYTMQSKAISLDLV